MSQAASYSIDNTWRTLLKDLGIPAAPVLRRAGLPDDLFDRPAARLAAADYYRLWDSIEQASGDPVFPLTLCQTVSSEGFPPLLFAALCSPHLLAAADRVARYKALVAPMRAEVILTDELATLDFSWPHPPPPPPPSLVLKELLVAVTIARVGTREHVCPIELTTPVLPDPAGPYEEYLGAPIRLGSRHRVVFTLADASRPFLTSDEAMWSAFEPALRQRLTEVETPRSTTRRVRAALLDLLPGGRATIEQIGRRLAVSTRTLQRRIAEEGTSFQAILAETREALARHYLEHTAMPVTDIALLLGYDEPNSFSRAFKAWTGTTPDSVRRARHAPTYATATGLGAGR